MTHQPHSPDIEPPDADGATSLRRRPSYRLRTLLLWSPAVAAVLAVIIRMSEHGVPGVLFGIAFFVVGLPFIFFAEIVDWLLGVNRGEAAGRRRLAFESAPPPRGDRRCSP